ncbi:hypothetical protein LOTGIDRAFT_180671 [Lottia gigantea]|uniref:Citrate transporter-like domain-containing protein n=1 Tax=Lottia gigantea TaxID=225164 RepID=V4AED4_LOTGI|nr:hypothetical protein LOTGIDRAFT_180671 [Lottia gigantea]ESO95247.1 hypothetical protein LOTGIDRAFT_180671 [Lottia gigantea]
MSMTENLINHQIHCNLSLTTDYDKPVPIEYSYLPIGQQAHNGVYYAAAILLTVYILIIFELVHRTVAALIGSFAAIAVLSALNERPTTDTIISWIDMETMMLLFGMMILVAIFAETGFFDYSALKTKITLLLYSLIASVSDPDSFRLCEVLNLDPKQILIAEVLFSNIGGTATAIGDPPNVIIVGALSSQGISFSVFTVHAFLGILFIIVGAYGLLRFYYRNAENLKNPESPEVREILRHEIGLWKKAASRISVVTREESVMRVLFLQKSVELENELNRELHRQRTFDAMMRKEYKITDPWLLVKSGIVLSTVILVLFIHSFVPSIHVGIGWTAVTGAVWLIVIANIADIDNILHKVEWSTLLFFSALFVLMEALAELGLIQEIGNLVSQIIESVEPDSRTIAAVSIIIWISAIASSFIDNIPYTTAMVPVLVNISENPELDLPILPLVMALAFGACLGGNGTLIGASANVVCTGIAEQHGYGITFAEFFKVGFPMMLVTTLLAHVYLIVCHVLIEWNSVNL